MKPQEAAACRGVQPSLSPLLTSLPLSTRNCTISAFSSMQACQRTHSHMMDCYKSVYCCRSGSTRQSPVGSVERVFDPPHFGLLWKAKLQSLPKSIKFNSSSGAKIMTTVSAPFNDFVKWAANSPQVLSKTQEWAKQRVYLAAFPEARSNRDPNVIQHRSQDESHEDLMVLC